MMALGPECDYMDKYHIIGEFHESNVISLFPAMHNIFIRSLYPHSSRWYADEVVPTMKNIGKKYFETREKYPEVRKDMNRIARVTEERIEKALMDMTAADRSHERKNFVKDYCFSVEVAKKCQQVAIDTIKSTMPKVLYLEGVMDGIDDVREIAVDFTGKVIYLDEGVPAYGTGYYNEKRDIDDVISDARRRDAVWIPKMVEHGPGLAIIGAGHVDNIKKGLEGLGKEVEVIFNAKTYVPDEDTEGAIIIDADSVS